MGAHSRTCSRASLRFLGDNVSASTGPDAGNGKAANNIPARGTSVRIRHLMLRTPQAYVGHQCICPVTETAIAAACTLAKCWLMASLLRDRAAHKLPVSSMGPNVMIRSFVFVR